jgi:SEC-C motif domain protein
MSNEVERCPCHSGAAFADCCAPCLVGRQEPRTALALMRSRYAAYARGDITWLEVTSGGEARAEFSPKDARAWANTAVFTGLDVLDVVAGGESDAQGIVEFVARWSEAGRDRSLRERSRFERENGFWRYVGREKGVPVAREAAKVGRNDPCPCGSGRKYKKCCGA